MENMTATEVRVRESLYFADFVRAKEALVKAQVPMSSFSVSPPAKEVDTYTLIPNGYEWTTTQSGRGQLLKTIPAYLIQHDQSGKTIAWKGPALSNYRNPFGPEFKFFFALTDKGRKKWKGKELKRIKLESEKPMSYDYNDDDFDSPCTGGECLFYGPKEKKMNYATANIIATTTESTEDKQRDYLHSRLDSLEYKKRDELRTFFKLDPVKPPKTLKEFLQKIKDGDISYDEKKLDKDFYYVSDITSVIRWTKDPADEAGYKAAIDNMNKAVVETRDIINILSPEEGLKAVKAFEAQTFH